MIDILEIKLDTNYDFFSLHINNRRFWYVRQDNNIFDLEHDGYKDKVKLEDLNNFEIEYLKDYVLALQLDNL
jgi:hypothetical protein